jgi:hypothetical protein
MNDARFGLSPRQALFLHSTHVREAREGEASLVS